MSIFGGKTIVFAKMKKKVPSPPFVGHPAAPPETESFFSLAQGSFVELGSY